MEAGKSRLPLVLTIAGSDSGGGAGIQADLKTFAALGAFGASAVTAITAQNPAGVTAIQGIDPQVVAEQIRAVADYFPIGAAKIGMLFSREIIEAVAGALEQIRAGAPGGGGQQSFPLVVDPVMVAASGAKLLNDDAVGALRERILPLASLITPNMAEAALLAGRPVEEIGDLEPAARAINERYGVPVLVKGGHLKKSKEALDVLWDGERLERFKLPFINLMETHGTGCTLSSAIAVYLMHGRNLTQAITAGKEYLHRALAGSLPAGPGTTLNHAFAPKPMTMLT